MKRKLFIVMAFMAIGAGLTFGQRGYTEFGKEENLMVMYRWQRASFFQKDSDAVLNLRVTNENESAVEWTFTVGFYNDEALMYESEQVTLCLKPGQSRRGGLAGLRFTVDGMKMDAVEDEKFSWEFGVYDVDEVEDCN